MDRVQSDSAASVRVMVGKLCLIQGGITGVWGRGGLLVDPGEVVLCEAEASSGKPPPEAVTMDLSGPPAVLEDHVPLRSVFPPTISAPMNPPQYGVLHGDQDIGGLMYHSTSSVLSGV